MDKGSDILKEGGVRIKEEEEEDESVTIKEEPIEEEDTTLVAVVELSKPIKLEKIGSDDYIVDEILPYYCDVCDRSFSRNSTLKYHYNLNHTNDHEKMSYCYLCDEKILFP